MWNTVLRLKLRYSLPHLLDWVATTSSSWRHIPAPTNSRNCSTTSVETASNAAGARTELQISAKLSADLTRTRTDCAPFLNLPFLAVPSQPYNHLLLFVLSSTMHISMPLLLFVPNFSTRRCREHPQQTASARARVALLFYSRPNRTTRADQPGCPRSGGGGAQPPCKSFILSILQII